MKIIDKNNELEALMMTYKQSKGEDYVSILNDLLDFIIGYLDPTCKPVEGWKHSGEENQLFSNMMNAYFALIVEKVSYQIWYDAWGDLIMSMRAKGGGFEQYFTPTSICNFLSSALIPFDDIGHEMTPCGVRAVISDPSCGSSRNLLSAHAMLSNNSKRAPYCIGEDIDMLCCKISAVNLAVHGACGEIVCHDTISEPDTIRAGWLINHELYNDDTGVPSIVRSNDKQKYHLFNDKGL